MGATHYLRLYLYYRDYAQRIRARDGELYICDAECVYVNTKDPPTYGDSADRFLAALQGLLISLAVSESTLSDPDTTRRISLILEERQGATEVMVFDYFHGIMKGGWGYAKISTHGKAREATNAAMLSDIVSSARSWISTDLSRRTESKVWRVLRNTCATPIPPPGDFSFTDYWLSNEWAIGERE